MRKTLPRSQRAVSTAARATSSRRVGRLLPLAAAAAALGACTSNPNASDASVLVEQGSNRPTLELDALLAQDLLAARDPDVDPCRDFYRHACGGWLAATALPPGERLWMRGPSEARQRMLETIRARLDALPAAPDDPALGALASFYASCRDLDAIEDAGVRPLASLLLAIDALETPSELMQLAARLEMLDVEVLLGTWVAPADTDPGTELLHLLPGGLSVPDTALYLSRTERARALRERYRDLLVELFTLAGSDPERATTRADAALRVERKLAQRVSATPQPLAAPIDGASLERLAALPWRTWLEALGVDANRRAVLLLHDPAALAGITEALADLDDARDYLAARLLVESAPSLSSAFADAHARFFAELMPGAAPHQRPRWVRCLDEATFVLPDAVGRLVLDEHDFTHAHDLTAALRAALDDALRSAPWLDANPRAEARSKLEALHVEIGRPEQWGEYTAPALPSGYLAASHLLLERAAAEVLAQVGKPRERTRWPAAATEVGVSYELAANTLRVPGGSLQPPLDAPEYPAAMRFATLGAMLGHELVHAVDQGGRRVDASGAARDWWTPSTEAAFAERLTCVEVQATSLEDASTADEALAELAGLELAWRAWQTARPHTPRLTPLAGLDEDALFFLAFAQMWCTVSDEPRVEAAARARVNGALAHLPQFGAAFGCDTRSAMQHGARCAVW